MYIKANAKVVFVYNVNFFGAVYSHHGVRSPKSKDDVLTFLCTLCTPSRPPLRPHAECRPQDRRPGWRPRPSRYPLSPWSACCSSHRWARAARWPRRHWPPRGRARARGLAYLPFLAGAVQVQHGHCIACSRLRRVPGSTAEKRLDDQSINQTALCFSFKCRFTTEAEAAFSPWWWIFKAKEICCVIQPVSPYYTLLPPPPSSS